MRPLFGSDPSRPMYPVYPDFVAPDAFAYNLPLGYTEVRMTTIANAASLMGHRSAQARIRKWGRQEFIRRMRTWGKLGGRPKGSGKKKGGAR